MSEVIPVPFHESELLTVQKDGIVHVMMRPVAESLGLDWSAQRQRIMRHPVLSASVVIITTRLDQKLQ